MLTLTFNKSSDHRSDLVKFVQPWQDALELKSKRKNSNRIQQSHISAES